MPKNVTTKLRSCACAAAARSTLRRRTLGGEPVEGFSEDFAYDPVGNRVTATDYDETGAPRVSLYTANSLNQYTQRTVPGWASVRGLANADATVTVNGSQVFRAGEYYFGSDSFDNSTSSGWAELETYAAFASATNGPDLVSSVTNLVFVPAATETFAYDADGNQTRLATGTGVWQVEYNGENRPVRWTCGERTILMSYDHQGRRKMSIDVADGITNSMHRFTYDNYLCVLRSRDADQTVCSRIWRD